MTWSVAGARNTELTVQTARRLAITKQHLSGRLKTRPSSSDILRVVKDMSYVQLDPISSVAPSHLLVLHSRLGNFRESDLDRLLWKDKKLFEYWAHVASIVLTEDYPLYLPRMRQFHLGNRVWDRRLREWMEGNQPLREYVLGELKARGPLSLRDFDDVSDDAWEKSRRKWGLKPSAWSEGRSVSRMVELLFHNGTVMVVGREGRQKIYDLSQRFLPAWTPRTELSSDEVEMIGAQRSLKALGVATPRQIAGHFLIWRYPHLKSTIGSLTAGSRFMPVDLKGAPEGSGTYYIHADDLDLADSISKGDWEPRTALLSPFDNLIADRDRTHFLFDYFFRIEIYTPKAKRKHGYYVMTILDGDRLIGRLDPAMDRQNERLVIKAMHAEPKAPGGRAAASRIGGAIDDLAEFLGAKEVVYSGKVPAVWRAHLG